MRLMTNRISGIDDADMRCTLNALREFGNDQRVGRITVTPIMKMYRRVVTAKV